MRRLSIWSILFLCGGVAAVAQQPSAAPAEQSAAPPAQSAAPPAQSIVQPATDEPEDRVRKDDRVAPPTPAELRENEIRQFDPLDRDDEQVAADKEKEKKAKRQRDSSQPPVPGSIAASDAKNAAAKSEDGPLVVDGETETQQPYAGPAVLSHSYSLNSSLIPDNVQWTTFFGISNTYNTGVNAVSTGPQGPVQNASSYGMDIKWGISGRHKFRRDSLGIMYNGDRPWYAEGAQYAGLNTRLAFDYTHPVSRRLAIKVNGTGSIFSQSYALQNTGPGPETPAADINVATTSLTQIFDNGFKTFNLGVSAAWQQSSRLSFTAAASVFDTSYNNPDLLSIKGEQFQGGVNYRFTSRTTAGIFYSYSLYTFPNGAGITDSQSLGGLYSYAFSRTTRLQLRAGEGVSETHAYQVVALNPIVAALFGLQSETINGYYRSLNEDISASITKDFGRRDTFSASYSKGVSPGNGIYLAGVSETINVSTTLMILGRTPIRISAGRSSISSAAQSAGSYVTDFVSIGSTRPLTRSMVLTFGADYHYYQISEFPGLRNQIALNCGFMWNRSESRLWPLW